MTTSTDRFAPIEAAWSLGRWITTSHQGAAPRILTCGGPASITSVTGTLKITVSTVSLWGRTYEVGGMTTPRRKS